MVATPTKGSVSGRCGDGGARAAVMAVAVGIEKECGESETVFDEKPHTCFCK